MRLTCLTLTIVLFILCISILASIVSNLISHDENDPEDEDNAAVNEEGHNLHKLRDLKYKKLFKKRLGTQFEHLMWFIQISDLHLSIFHDSNRISEFKKFTNQTLDAIKPTVVLASGDLADGKSLDTMGSNQYLEEWQYYQNALELSNVTKRTIWLDIRGNHDNFNVPGIHHEKSYFHKYSIQGTKHLRSYMYNVIKDNDKYAFIAVDACLEPGPRRPFNFFGSITLDQYTLLEKFEYDSTIDENVLGTIWFGHYPTSCVLSPEPGFRYLMRNGVAYLCGHLHTLGGVVPHMYTLHKTGILELELGDWKDNRLFRVAAFDHGIFSFIDVVHNQWPIILITNPKHALYALPKKEALNEIKESTHVRILVFSPYPLELVQLRFNDIKDWKKCQHVKGPLYVAEWNPSDFPVGIHRISVYARDHNGHSNEIQQPFSIDGTRPSFDLLPRIALMTDASTLFFGAFVFLVLFTVVPLFALRWLHYLATENRVDINLVHDVYLSNLIRRLWLLCSIDKLYFPIIFYPLYITVGPWFIGEVIEGHLGATFSWGTYVQGKLLPTAFTYFYGVMQLMWFHIPFVILLSYCVESRFQDLCLENGTLCCERSFCKRHIPCGFVLLTQSVFAFYFWQAYGTLALILGMFRTWHVLLGIYLFYTSATLTKKDVEEARVIWRNRHLFTQNNGRTDSRHDL